MSYKKIENAPKHRMQKIVIPKGTINGNETTVIEIPSDLQRTPLIIAKRKTYVKPEDMVLPVAKHTYNYTRFQTKVEKKPNKPITPVKPAVRFKIFSILFYQFNFFRSGLPLHRRFRQQ